MTGFARLLRTNAHAAMENIALWHERDISHSSVERIILPDSTSLADYMLEKMTFLFKNFNVYPKNMMKNINLTNGLIFSQEVLLALVKSGKTRVEAYEMVQRNAMKTWDEGSSFMMNLKNDSEVMESVNANTLDSLFDLDKILVNINKIFERLKING